jgi:hypothetical protein
MLRTYRHGLETLAGGIARSDSDTIIGAADPQQMLRDAQARSRAMMEASSSSPSFAAAQREQDQFHARGMSVAKGALIGTAVGAVAGAVGGALLWPAHRFLGGLLVSVLVGAPVGAGIGVAVNMPSKVA